ncbi:unnamed protein product [Oikopleura dioica]|uniref:Uncharacterized protein n=1 Tax=Oikopleura dioica TaxID=34765 RepID=E4YF37_OIKDI|nr:unnamed protein product [Oikopleura dioica]
MENLLKKLIIQKSFRAPVKDISLFNVAMSINISTNDKTAQYNLTKEGYFEIAQLCPEFNQFLVFPKIQEPPDTAHAACQTNANIQVCRAKLEMANSSVFIKKEPFDEYESCPQNEMTQDDIEITEVEEEESDEEESEQETKRARIESDSHTVSDCNSVENITIESEEVDNEFASMVPIICDSDSEEPSFVKKARKSEREKNKPQRFIPSKPERRIRQYQPKEEELVSKITSSNPSLNIPPSMSAPITVHLRRAKRHCIECPPKIKTRCRVFCDNCNSAVCKDHRYIICRSCGERLLQSTPNRVYQMKPLKKMESLVNSDFM